MSRAGSGERLAGQYSASFGAPSAPQVSAIGREDLPGGTDHGRVGLARLDDVEHTRRSWRLRVATVAMPRDRYSRELGRLAAAVDRDLIARDESAAAAHAEPTGKAGGTDGNLNAGGSDHAIVRQSVQRNAHDARRAVREIDRGCEGE